jgi:predicted component of type VI protein secretion system
MSTEPAAGILVLELVGERAGTLGRASRRVFNATAGTIGRAANSSWVLPEAWVSATHARIDFSDDGFTLTDVSTNRIDVAEPGHAIEPGKPYPIRNHTRFFIGEFEIQATLLDRDGLPLSRSGGLQWT